MKHFAAVFISVLLSSFGIPGQTQELPPRTIRLVVMLPPGSGVDIMARLLAPKMSEQLKQNIVIDNRAGASGIIGTEIVKNARPDGATLLLTSSAFAINATLYEKLPYEPLKDFTFIGLCGSTPTLLVVTPQLQAKTVGDLIALAKARPGQLNYGSSGTGTTVHLTAVLFTSMTGIKATHVPYKGVAQTLTDVVGGRLDFTFAGVAGAMQLANAGKLRVLGITGTKRSNELPDVPSIKETIPGYEAMVWFGMMGPTGMPRPIVNAINHALNDSIRLPDIQKKLMTDGVDPITSSPEEFEAYVRREIKKWGAVIKESGARAEQ